MVLEKHRLLKQYQRLRTTKSFLPPNRYRLYRNKKLPVTHYSKRSSKVVCAISGSYCMENWWDEVARVCMTHSFPLAGKELDVVLQEKEAARIREYVLGCDYDFLI